MNVFGIGLPEMVLIFVVALLVFGPKKLPEIGKTLGKTIRGFQDASKEFEQEFKREAEKIEQVISEPMKATIAPPAQITGTEDIPEATLVEETLAEETLVKETLTTAPIDPAVAADANTNHSESN
jgi:sec-independent protein translocase protein TatA